MMAGGGANARAERRSSVQLSFHLYRGKKPTSGFRPRRKREKRRETEIKEGGRESCGKKHPDSVRQKPVSRCSRIALQRAHRGKKRYRL